jgi:hypothetical protein
MLDVHGRLAHEVDQLLQHAALASRVTATQRGLVFDGGAVAIRAVGGRDVAILVGDEVGQQTCGFAHAAPRLHDRRFAEPVGCC